MLVVPLGSKLPSATLAPVVVSRTWYVNESGVALPPALLSTVVVTVIVESRARARIAWEGARGSDTTLEVVFVVARGVVLVGAWLVVVAPTVAVPAALAAFGDAP